MKDSKQYWAITYQILKVNKIYDIPIRDEILNIFKKSKILNNIKKYKDVNNKQLGSTNIIYPELLFLCKKDGDIYVNVYYDEGENSQNTKTLIFDRIHHPILKDIYLFSKERFPSDKNIEQVKCFVVFTNLENKIEGEIINIPEAPVIGFTENEKEFWCCKSPRFFVESGEH